MPRDLPSIYFMHETRQPHNVLLAWHGMLVVPRVGDHLSGLMGEWEVTRVVWVAVRDDRCDFARIDVHVRDRVTTCRWCGQTLTPRDVFLEHPRGGPRCPGPRIGDATEVTP